MENPPPINPQSHAFGSCPVCHAPTPDWLPRCVHCGVDQPQPKLAAEAEIRHIDYVLWQLPCYDPVISSHPKRKPNSIPSMPTANTVFRNGSARLRRMFRRRPPRFCP